MLVTINTDACFHTRLKVGGYAFWAICNDFKITKSGVFRNKCINSDDAETKCIINALSTVLKTHKGISKIIVNTDSLNAIAYLRNDKTHIRKYRLIGNKKIEFRRLFCGLVKNTVVEFRHVKAHSGVDDARSFVNEWCDINAKKMMWDKINNQKIINNF